jgi:hypothetical protein
MTSQRDEMANPGATASTSAGESAVDRRTPPPLVVSAPDGTDAPDRPDARPDAPATDEDGVVLAEDDIILEKGDEPVGAEHGPVTPADRQTLADPADEGELGTPAEPVIPAGRGTSVPAGSPDDPAATAAPGERDVFGAARGVGEPGTVPASTDPADDLAAEPPAGRAAEAATPGPAGRETATAEPAAAGGIPAATLAEQQWPQIMALFVDDPHGSVERAAAAASEVAAALTASLEREQDQLRASWRDNASTEDLRTALQQYRAFCGRLESLG